jgi:hypothetical protein
MATPAVVNVRPERQLPAGVTPLLEAGDRLSRDEFESRYERMPHLKKAELIEGIVYMPSPVRASKHAEPYSCPRPGWEFTLKPRGPCFDNSTLRLDRQRAAADLVLLKGRRWRPGSHPPTITSKRAELVVERRSSRAYDLI